MNLVNRVPWFFVRTYSSGRLSSKHLGSAPIERRDGPSECCATYWIITRWIIRALFSKKWGCHYIDDGTVRELFLFLVHMECHMDSNSKAGEEE